MDLYKNIGNYRRYTHCRFCFEKLSKPVIYLGYVPLAGGFIKKEQFKNEKFYPLEISFCHKCVLLQSINVIDKDILFKNYFYFSSKSRTLSNYFTQIAQELNKSFKNPKKKFIVEIGCNDGILLEKMSLLGLKTLGVDPALNVTNSIKNKKIKIIKDYFTESLSKKILNKYGKADTIVSFNTLAHIEDMHDVMKGIKHLLKEDGFLEFGVHYLGKLVKENQYDMIYHEHQYYYSLTSLTNFIKQYDMEVFDLKKTNLHAGSIIFYIQNKQYGKRKLTDNVIKLKNEEIKNRLNNSGTYIKLMTKIEKRKNDLIKTLTKLRGSKKRIIGYGASGRGTIIMTYSSLTNKLLDYVVDDSPVKQGTYTPGNHLKIYPSNELYSRNKPDFVLLFAWPYLDEVKKRHQKFLKNGGRLIIPLPKVKIISQ